MTSDFVACDVRGSRRAINYFQSRSKPVVVTYLLTTARWKHCGDDDDDEGGDDDIEIHFHTPGYRSDIFVVFHCFPCWYWHTTNESKNTFFLYLCGSIAVTSNVKRLRWQISNIGHRRQRKPYHFLASITVFHEHWRNTNNYCIVISVIIIVIVIIIRHELGLNRPIGISSNSHFKGLLSRLRPFEFLFFS